MEGQDDNIEIIEFIRPLQNCKNLFITNLSSSFQPADLERILYETFSEYGLLYEVQVVSLSAPDEDSASSAHQDSGRSGFYAFVKYYSARAAAKAQKQLTGRLFFHGQHAKVRFANRKGALPDVDAQPLYMSKCYELANHYLGFDGWSTHILAMRPDSSQEESDAANSSEQKIRYVCVVKLVLPKHGLHAEAIGLGEQTWNKTDPLGRGVALCKCRKQAYQRAVENVFRKVIFVVLEESAPCRQRIHVEVNTTIQEVMLYDDDLKQHDMIKVNELDEEPPEGGETINEDDKNIHLLQQLEDNG